MKIGKILSITLIACMVSSLLAACGGNRTEAAAVVNGASTPAPASNAGTNAANGLVYGLTETYMTNTDMPSLKFGDIQLVNITPVLAAKGKFSFKLDPTSDSAFERVVKSLISSHGQPYELKYDEGREERSALWKTKDGKFMIWLLLGSINGNRALRLAGACKPGAGANAANSPDQEVSLTYTTNTDMPPLKIGDIQFYKGPHTVPGEYEFHTDVIQSDKVFNDVLESLKSSYGPCEQRHHDMPNEQYDMTTAAWISEDYTFSMDLILYNYKNGARFLQMLVYKWPE